MRIWSVELLTQSRFPSQLASSDRIAYADLNSPAASEGGFSSSSSSSSDLSDGAGAAGASGSDVAAATTATATATATAGAAAEGEEEGTTIVSVEASDYPVALVIHDFVPVDGVSSHQVCAGPPWRMVC